MSFRQIARELCEVVLHTGDVIYGTHLLENENYGTITRLNLSRRRFCVFALSYNRENIKKMSAVSNFFLTGN